MSDFDLALQILPYVAAHGGITVNEVATEFGVAPKKVHQLVNLLSYTGRGQFGGELVDITVTDDGAIYVRDAQSLDQPVALTGGQAFIILAGLAYLQNIPAFCEQAEVTLLIEKISEALEIEVPAVAVATSARQTKSIELLRRAIQERDSVSIDYSSASATHSPKRVIDPLSLVVSEDRTYVNAWCHEAQSVRSFRVDRIAALELTGEKFEPYEIDQEPLVGLSVTLRVSTDAISEFDVLQLDKSTKLPDGRFEITLQVANEEWLLRMALAQGGDVEVISPDHIRLELQNRARRWHARG